MDYRKGIAGIFFCVFFPLLFSSAEESVHIVERGETIFSIARSYQVDQNELMRLNGISDPARLRLGQSLKIPGSTPVSAVSHNRDASHRTARGDTLYSIARKYGISVEALMTANGFPAAYVLKEGDLIRVPEQAAASAAPENRQVQPAASRTVDTTVRWPVNAREMHYMTGRPGVEITGERAEPVKSLTRGMVISAGPFRDYGRVAIIQTEGGYYYVYGGCEVLLVQEGDRVGPGTELGRLGIDNASGKPLLKFLVYQSNTPIDPAKAPRA